VYPGFLNALLGLLCVPHTRGDDATYVPLVQPIELIEGRRIAAQEPSDQHRLIGDHMLSKPKPLQLVL
jgi:hypothetical protein